MAEDENNGERVLEHYGPRPTAGIYGQYPPRSRNSINDNLRIEGDMRAEKQKPQSSVDEQEHEDESRSVGYGGGYRCRCCCCCCCRCRDNGGYGSYNDAFVPYKAKELP